MGTGKLYIAKEFEMSCIEHFKYYDSILVFPSHQHTSCEILYLHKGHISIVCGDDEFHMTDNTVCIIPSCIKHRIVIKDSDQYERTIIFLNPWTYTREFYSDAIYNMIMGFITKRPIVLKDDFNCLGYFEKIRRELKTNDILSEDAVISSVTQMLIHFFRNSGYLEGMMKKSDKMVFEIQRYIQENCGEQILISDIADKFYISKFYLTHIFKKQTGMSPRNYLTLTRLTKAYNMLHDSQLKISEIAGRCGFTSSSDMARKFKEHYDVSPNEFRKRILSKSKNNIL